MNLQGKIIVINPGKNIMFYDDLSGFKFDTFNNGNPSEIKIPDDFPEEKLITIKKGLEYKLLLFKEEVPLTVAKELDMIKQLVGYFKTVRTLKDIVNITENIELLNKLLVFEESHQNRKYVKSVIKAKIHRIQGIPKSNFKGVLEKDYQIKNIVEK